MVVTIGAVKKIICFSDLIAGVLNVSIMVKEDISCLTVKSKFHKTYTSKRQRVAQHVYFYLRINLTGRL